MPGNDQVEIAFLQRVVGGKRHELAANRAQADRADRPLERQRREAQRGRGPVHRQHVAVVLPVAGHHERLNLHLVAEAVGKQRPDGPVHQPRREGFLDRGPAFAFEETPGKLARRGDPLAIVASQGEEIARPRRAGHGCRQDDRLAILHQATPGRLFRQLTCFDRKNRCSNLTFNSNFQVFPYPFDMAAEQLENCFGRTPPARLSPPA